MRLDAVSKRYGWGQPWVIKDVSLDIRPGELVRLEGKNGTGKSTLLRMIAGVSAPTKGAVTGRPVTGFVPERFPPGLPFSARDYLHHLGRIQGLDGRGGLGGQRLETRVDACLERLGGLEFATVPMRNMSKGMCQKVAVAQALLPESGMLVLDEAWTGLDVDARAALDEVVAERLAGGGSVVFVDHDPRRLEHLEADRWCIEHGQAVRVPSPPEAETPPAPPSTTMIIYVVGCPPERLRTLPGVLTATAEDDGVTLRVEPDRSDAVLRAVLSAGDDVHIRHVGREGRVGREGDER